MPDIEGTLRKYILEKLMFTTDAKKLGANDSLIDSRVLDPTGVGVHGLVNFVEKTFAIRVDGADLVPENFETLAKLVAFVERKLSTPR
jgi:acyl carrier protein